MISVVDLGIVRQVKFEAGELVVAITPTYSGCPATEVIARDIEQSLRSHGIEKFRLESQISPPLEHGLDQPERTRTAEELWHCPSERATARSTRRHCFSNPKTSLRGVSTLWFQ